MKTGKLAAMLLLLLVGCQTSPQRHVRVETRIQLGLAYLSKGNMDAARRNLQRALSQAPDDYRVQLAMARYQQQTGDRSRAEHHYHRALAQAPSNGYVLNNYGAFLCGLGQYDAAQRQFSLARKDSANGLRADSVENSGYCFLNAGQQEKARQALVDAVQTDPTKGLPMLAEAARRLGKGRRSESRLLLDVYQHNFPVSAESLWLEIRFAAQAKRPADVQHHGAQLAQIFPQSIQYQHFLANEY
ncbi:type IV pilus biogenesis/stability protein PilW [Erwinia pyrifoliae]|uniref:Type IV pilus biogenesis/stability protein PilW n=1 Tax=Erwinia pyrifoliae TaxID=79967 RepID=A0ABY5XAJ1_ERWPY|nr:type IV pilus biogenesis/stability protein PilW [Erwinia pyrifoliae]AUX73402.1 type IV pilus biogenesis/stability protein PilW [Erwinia pyrifoliae]MCA8876300.1 type IV pilus biogenesis/stability protein PilW [Erwinia pyrifoliae]MCT2386440.1 type IV pilus biogenesis/stability protein PilW [Erwinia pyrifoliae]MCU8587963.1 type IV pilus biogenesis/stability protein PilW [Erwinia pyrifoliae]UWS28368.1 type IV pilus biogenesis/stability protein PilW [Erwinia pyrifoliae]